MEYVKYNNTDITTDIKQPNDNILDNADFRSGIINQQGFNTYMYSNKSMLTIDRWITYGPNVNINTNSITMANRTTSPHTVQQHLYTQYKAGDKLTLYVSAFDITGNVYVYLTGLDNQKKKLVNGDNIFTFTLTSKIDNFFIYLEPNAVASFNCLKLEEGDHFTGMPVWKELEELDKCLRKQFPLGVGWGNQYPARSDNINHTVFIALPFIPRKAPALISIDDSTTKLITFTGNNVTPFNLSFDSYGGTAVSGSGIVIYYPIGSTPQIGFGQVVFNSNIILDFNDY